jgi:broad specificity phosphatase PhoE
MDSEERAIWLVRHGESTWNARGLIQGHADESVLTAEGRRQSAASAEQLRHVPVGALFASDLQRAQQTAAFFAEVVNLPVQCTAALRERCFGTFEGRPQQALTPADTGIANGRITDVDARPEQGESLRELSERVVGFVDALGGNDFAMGDIILVTHGGTIRALRAHFMGVSLGEMAWDEVSNGSVRRMPRAAAARAVNG